jgi:hypothetical protein
VAKVREGLGSGHQMGLSPISKEKLMVVGECIMGGALNIKKIGKIGNVFGC